MAATVAVAIFSASRLADAPVRGRLGGPDPLGAVASLAALAIGIVAFVWLGGTIARDGSGQPAALGAGAIGGALTGIAGGLAQAAALADYLGAVLAGYAVPPEYLAVALGAYVAIATLGAATIGAAITYAGWHRARSREASR